MNYLLVWGCWAKSAPNTYVAKSAYWPLKAIDETEGYDIDEIRAISRLRIGEKWESELGNHLIVRMS